MTSTVSVARLDDYRQVAPRGAVDLLLRLGERLQGRSLVNVSGSRYRGLTIEVLNRLVPVLNDLGIDTSWEVTIGTGDFESITHTVARALAGTEQVVTDDMLARLREVCAENAKRLRLDADLVMVHDAAPLLVVESRADNGRWLWRCHHDLSSPQPQLWNMLRPVAQRYDAVIFSDARFAASLSVPRFVIHPSVDPLSERNRDMGRSEQATHLDRLRVPRDKPFLLQIGQFQRSHDPLGVINAYRLVKKHYDLRLVLAGSAPRSADGDECPRAGSHHRHLQAAQRGLRHQRVRGHVEGQARGGQPRWGNTQPDPSWRHRLHGGDGGGRGLPHPASPRQSGADRPHGRGWTGAHPSQLPDHAPSGRLSGAARHADQVRRWWTGSRPPRPW